MRSLVVASTIALLCSTGSLPARADETGFAEMHDLRREGGKLCMAEHWHYGSGSERPSRKAAEADAAQSWSAFTAFEYGTTWASFNLAAAKSFDCSNSASGVSCTVSARPCRSAKR